MARLARLALALYPLAYRRRYGEEMAALVEDSGATPALVADLLRGAVRAHLRPEPAVAGAVAPEERLRLGLRAILLCGIVFVAAGLGLAKTTEDHPFSVAGHAHPLLGGAHLAVQILAALAIVPGLVVAYGAFAPAKVGRLAPACAVAVVLAMAGIAAATGVYLVAMLGDAPALAGEGNGPLQLVSVAASLAIQLAVMAAVVVPAGLSAARARHAYAR